MNRIKAWLIFVIGAGVLVALDLWLKSWAQSNLQGGLPRDFIPGILGLTYYENPGAAFGFLGGFEWSQWILSAVKIVILLVLLWYYNRLPMEKKYWLTRVPLILIFAGGVGNLIDRVSLGVVRDMLEFLFMNFAIFNLADVFVVAGVFSLLIFEIFVVKDFTESSKK